MSATPVDVDGSAPLLPCEPSLEALEHALETILTDATPATKDSLRRLASYRTGLPFAQLDFPKNKLAAVLVLLHLNPLGELSVTLTTRSSRLRSHPGETALPGGRWEEGDGEGGVWTAYREAHEEIGLPLPSRESVFHAESSSSSPLPPPPASHLLHLTTLPPFTSRTLLVVLPVVALLVKPAATAASTYLPRVLRPNPDEVAAVFHLPLQAFLLRASSPPAVPAPASSSPSSDARRRTRSSTAPRSAPPPPPPPGTESLSHSFADFTWLLERPYRLHSFSSAVPGVTPSAVTGLTADIVVRCAMVAESGRLGLEEGEGGEGEEEDGKWEGLREPGFEREAEGQLGWEETVRVALGLEGRQGLGGRVGAGAGA
ncbi:hypothetical protein DMC30DRAFT_406495 [Rhodotorula diobovata]|uniref:Nudix hydrolase domain-containing protein n=1 Tax=Rhodotorula diobovata TaxID=5288 RepID=A0A5C5FLK7_9BASI|nr:hypothetical protein DMC30DRAFT_406495 [Rhodotorula diobovata]